MGLLKSFPTDKFAKNIYLFRKFGFLPVAENIKSASTLELYAVSFQTEEKRQRAQFVEIDGFTESATEKDGALRRLDGTRPRAHQAHSRRRLLPRPQRLRRSSAQFVGDRARPSQHRHLFFVR